MPTRGTKAGASRKRSVAAKKAAVTKKRRAAGKKAALTKKRSSAGRKAAATKTRRAAAKKAVATKTRRAAARKAVATRRSRTEDPERLAVSEELHPMGYDWRSECLAIRSVNRMEGGEMFSALRNGRPVLVSDEGTLADMVPEITDECISILEFRSVEKRAQYLRETRLRA